MLESTRRDLAFVPRWGIMRVLHRQSVAEHSYFATCYGLEIARLIDWPHGDAAPNVDWARHALAVYLLRHDEAESFESDIPGPIKRLGKLDKEALNPLARDRYGPKPISTDDMRAIRVAADLVDECMYLAGEIAMGNGTVRPALSNSLQRLGDAVAALPAKNDELRQQLNTKLLVAIGDETMAQKDLSGLVGDAADLHRWTAPAKCRPR